MICAHESNTYFVSILYPDLCNVLESFEEWFGANASCYGLVRRAQHLQAGSPLILLAWLGRPIDDLIAPSAGLPATRRPPC